MKHISTPKLIVVILILAVMSVWGFFLATDITARIDMVLLAFLMAGWATSKRRGDKRDP